MEQESGNDIVEVFSQGEENWRPIVGFEGYYDVSNFGRVRSKDRTVTRVNKGKLFFKGELKKQFIQRGYPVVNLSKNNLDYTIRVHRLVAMSFILNPNNYPQTNHIDGIKKNNHVLNLEWCTSKHNIMHAHRIGLIKRKTGINNKHNIPVVQLTNNGGYINEFYSMDYAYICSGIKAVNIGKACNKKLKTAGGFKWMRKSEYYGATV